MSFQIKRENFVKVLHYLYIFLRSNLISIFLVILVDIEKITNIIKGQTTLKFKKYYKLFQLATDNSFSIFYIDEEGVERSLDVIAPNSLVFKFVYNAISFLYEKAKFNLKTTSLEKRYLKRKWEGMYIIL